MTTKTWKKEYSRLQKLVQHYEKALRTYEYHETELAISGWRGIAYTAKDVLEYKNKKDI